MANENVIDTLTAELVIDGEKALRSIVEFRKQAKDEVESMTGDMKEALSDLDILSFLTEESERLQVSIEKVAEMYGGMAEVGGKTTEELSQMMVRFGERMGEIMPIITMQLAKLRGEAEAMGKAFTASDLAGVAERMVRVASAAETTGDAVKRVAQVSDNAKKAIAEQGRATRGTTDAYQAAGRAANALGISWSALISTGLGFLGLNALISGFARTMKEAAGYAIQMSGVMTRLALAVKANQKEFGEAIGTIDEWIAFVDQLTDMSFGLGKEDIAAATKQWLIYNQTLGLTKDQLQGLVEATVVLADVQGKSALSVTQAINQFLSTGYREGLVQLNFDVEALERQVGKSTREMTRQERVLYALPILLEQAGIYTEDLAQAQNSLAGQMKLATDRQEEAKQAAGALIAPFELLLKNIATWGLENFAKRLEGDFKRINKILAGLIAGFEALKFAAQQGWENVLHPIDALKGGLGRLGVQTRAVGDVYQEVYESNLKRFDEALEGLKSGTDGLTDSEKRLAQQTKELNQEFADLGDRAEELADGLFDIAETYALGKERAWNQLQATLKRIDDNLAKDRTRAWHDLQEDLTDIDRRAAEQRVQTIQDNYIAEERLKQDHLLNLRRMEEDYLLQLEDAVRERDARQILMLMRRHNLERQRAEEDYQIRVKRMRFDFQLELAEIEYQRQYRRALRIQEYNQALQDMDEQARLARAEAHKAFEDEKKQLLDEAQIKLDLLKGGAEAERRLRQSYLDIYYQDAKKYLGPDGFMDRLYEYATRRMAAQIQALNNNITAPVIYPNASDFYQYGGMPVATSTQQSDPFARTAGERQFASRYYQRGGEFVATSPTPIMVGERPEMVSVTPLGGAGEPVAGFDAGANEPMELRLLVDAEEGLAVRVAEQTMSRVADVVVSITKHAPGGPRV